MVNTTKRLRRGALAILATAGLVAAGTQLSTANAFQAKSHHSTPRSRTKTPIKHLVVLFDENVSYDHYFGTYPQATNSDGVTFHGSPHTPTNNNLTTSGALTSNPNVYAPLRLTHGQAATCDQNHGYTAEQNAVNGGAMDKFVESTSVDTCTGLYGSPGLAMDYYDGNTVTGLWNYAQNYAMSDNMWDTTFGPSTPGALNLISGQTHGGVAYDPNTGVKLTSSSALAASDASGVGTVIGVPDPVYDDCSDNDHTSTSPVVGMQGKNIGDRLNSKGVTWGWFQGGFTPSTKWDGVAGHHAVCQTNQTNLNGQVIRSYSPHHSPFEYYKSTSNPHHLAPKSLAEVGHNGRANHNYDLSYFNAAIKANKLPSVSFVKAPSAQDGHPASSNPIDEQKFLTTEINAIENSKEWPSTAIVVTYDDSDGWYDHVAPKILNGSADPVTDKTVCTTAAAVASTAPAGGYADRCGPSQRLPFLVISPYAKRNAVSHTKLEQSSVLTFIESNWKTSAIGDHSFDARANNITSLFTWSHPQQHAVLLRSDGTVKSIKHVKVG
ncbi:MAG: alkaline phosphatase family protein [Aeromicrobium sp.]|nr:alkaline phosphatase family protein [Aeromicrobium sp.]